MSDLLCVGDRIKDNDPRMPDRVLMVINISVLSGVYAQDRHGRCNWYRRDRIFTDSKPRRTGFSRVEAA